MSKSKIISFVIILVIFVATVIYINVASFELVFKVDNEVYETIILKHSDTFDVPADPVKDNFTFDGWYFDRLVWEKPLLSKCSIFDLLFKGKVVYAKWTTPTIDMENNVTVRFETRCDTTLDTLILNVNSYFAEPQICKTNFNLEGWYLSSDWGYTLDRKWSFANDKVTENIVLYAKWEPVFYTVNFITNGGSHISPQKVVYDGTVGYQTCVRDGYTLEGFFTDDQFTYRFVFGATKVTENLTLYAKWVANTYTVTFITNGGSSIDPIIMEYSAEFILPEAPTKEGSLFLGWYIDVGLTEKCTFTFMPSKNLTLYAKWSNN